MVKMDSWNESPSICCLYGIGQLIVIVLGGRSYVNDRKVSCQTIDHLPFVSGAVRGIS